MTFSERLKQNWVTIVVLLNVVLLTVLFLYTSYEFQRYATVIDNQGQVLGQVVTFLQKATGATSTPQQ